MLTMTDPRPKFFVLLCSSSLQKAQLSKIRSTLAPSAECMSAELYSNTSVRQNICLYQPVYIKSLVLKTGKKTMKAPVKAETKASILTVSQNLFCKNVLSFMLRVKSSTIKVNHQSF